MRILYSHRIASRDGQGVHVDELIDAFRAQGHEVRVVGPESYAQAEFGGTARSLGKLRTLLPGGATEVAEMGYAVLAYRRLLAAYREFRPDLVYERYNLFHLAGGLLARRHGARLFLEVNSPLAEERATFGSLRLKRLAHAVERWTWRSAARVLPVTGVLGATMVAAGVEPGRVAVVPNGVVLGRFAWPPMERREGPVRLGFVGFVRDWHGLDRVIERLAGAPDMILDIVGDGPAVPDLMAQAERLGLEQRVVFRGVVKPHLVPGLVARFDVALQPKVVAYASPLKNFDYMAAGRAIVAPDQPNIREILRHGETALLFAPDDPDALWAAVTRLVADGGLRERLGTAARADLEARDYTWAGNARRIAGMAAG